MSSAPLLADITVNGKPIKAVAVPSKQAWLYVFDRVDRAAGVADRGTAGAAVAMCRARRRRRRSRIRPSRRPTRATCCKVPDDLIDFTPELRAQALEALKRYKCAPTPFQPADPRQRQRAARRVIGNAGDGTNWPGGGFDPETHIVVRAGRQRAASRAIARRAAARASRTSATCRVSGGRPFREVFGPGDCCAADSPRTRDAGASTALSPGAAAAPAPRSRRRCRRARRSPCRACRSSSRRTACSRRSTSIAASSLWQVPHGDTPDNVRNHPALKGMNIPKTGQAGTSSVGLLVTKTLVVMGDPQVTTPPERPRGAMLRAYDKKTGQEVGAVWMPAPQSGSPMT